MTLSIDLPERDFERLRALAARLGVSPEQLVRAVLSDQLGAAPREDFEQVAARLLEKNRELYRRLA
jgi:hypothetical protein